MSYPMLVNWVDVRIVNKDKVVFKNRLFGNSHTLDIYTAWFAGQLDGKRNPYKIDRRLSNEDVDELLYELDDMDLLRERRVLLKTFAEIYLTVWIPHITSALRVLAHIVNSLLIVSWLPMLIISNFVFWNNIMYFSDEYMYIGIIIGIIIGMIFHEFGHMCAGLDYGGNIFELGVFVKYLLPGAYVFMDTSNIKSQLKKVQIDAAGVEMNFLLAGIFLLLSLCSETLSGLCVGISYANIFLSAINLMFIDGLDGIAIIGELLGVESLVDKSRKIIKCKRKKRKIAKNGLSLIGKVYIAVCYIINIIQLALPIIIVDSILEMISWFL